MILKQVRFRGLVVEPYQIVNNECFYFKDGKEIHYQYRLVKLPKYYVANNNLFMDDDITWVDGTSLMLESAYHFVVNDDVLTILN